MHFIPRCAARQLQQCLECLNTLVMLFAVLLQRLPMEAKDRRGEQASRPAKATHTTTPHTTQRKPEGKAGGRPHSQRQPEAPKQPQRHHTTPSPHKRVSMKISLRPITKAIKMATSKNQELQIKLHSKRSDQADGVLATLHSCQSHKVARIR